MQIRYPQKRETRKPVTDGIEARENLEEEAAKKLN